MGKSKCSVDNCVKMTFGKGLCQAHYTRWRRHGDVSSCREPRMTLRDRFWAKVDKSGDCWIWTGAQTLREYGQIKIDKKSAMAHRIAWQLEVGAIPEGLEIDHLCRNHSCVRPEHLEPVTHVENLARSPVMNWSGRKTETHCGHGHLLSAENTYMYPSGRKACRICKRSHAKKHKALRRQRMQKTRITVHTDDPASVVRTLRENTTPEFWAQLKELIATEAT